jgi:hypothetical protein
VGVALVLQLGTAEAKGPLKGEYSKEEILANAKELAQEVGMSFDKRDAVLDRLQVMLSENWTSKYGEGEEGKIRGLFAYQMGEGGLLVKVKKGHGRVRFVGSRESHDIELKSVSWGAVIGGSSEWGFGLVLGLGDESYFGGKYDGKSIGATAATASTNTTELRRKGSDVREDHRVVLIGTAAGLSANAAGATLNIKVKK